MKRRIAFGIILLGWSAILYSQNFTGGFNFYLPAQDITSQKFLPHFPPQPIAANDFIAIDAAAILQYKIGRGVFSASIAPRTARFRSPAKPGSLPGDSENSASIWFVSIIWIIRGARKACLNGARIRVT